jgi:hypothetical protein
MPGGTTLARLLAEQRKVRNHLALPHFTVQVILSWADAHHKRNGSWPALNSGEIPDTNGETWNAVDSALKLGRRGLPSGSSLARLLAEFRDIRNRKALPPLTTQLIFSWTKIHRKHAGRWPTAASGPIADTNGETWNGVNWALLKGTRSLPGGSSLAKLIDKFRRIRTAISSNS